MGTGSIFPYGPQGGRPQKLVGHLSCQQLFLKTLPSSP